MGGGFIGDRRGGAYEEHRYMAGDGLWMAWHGM